VLTSSHWPNYHEGERTVSSMDMVVFESPIYKLCQPNSAGHMFLDVDRVDSC
jgi:hypothetical protein